MSLINLADLYRSMGAYSKAEPLYARALAIIEKVLGPEHPNTATSLNNLAALYLLMGAYSKAEPLYARALAIREKVLGPEHPNTATSLNNLAVVYHSIGWANEGLPLLQRALQTLIVVKSPNELGITAHNLGSYTSSGKRKERRFSTTSWP